MCDDFFGTDVSIDYQLWQRKQNDLCQFFLNVWSLFNFNRRGYLKVQKNLMLDFFSIFIGQGYEGARTVVNLLTYDINTAFL